MNRKTYVAAANYRHFQVWCRSNNVSHNDPQYQYISAPHMLWGMDARYVDFAYYETWRDHPQAREIGLLIDTAISRAKFMDEIRPMMRSEVVEPNDNFWYKLTKLDPAVFRGLIVSVAALLASIGVAVSPDIPDAIIAFVIVLVPIIQALWTRPAVTANARVAVLVPDPVNAPDEVEPGEAVTTASNSDILSAAKA